MSTKSKDHMDDRSDFFDSPYAFCPEDHEHEPHVYKQVYNMSLDSIEWFKKWTARDHAHYCTNTYNYLSDYKEQMVRKGHLQCAKDIQLVMSYVEATMRNYKGIETIDAIDNFTPTPKKSYEEECSDELDVCADCEDQIQEHKGVQ